MLFAGVEIAMSEYQFHEFRALDRPLSAAQVADVRKVSSRAEVSSTRFVNKYNYGDFRGDVDDFLTRYFDALVYVANWGTRRFAFRLPRDGVDTAAIEVFAHENSLNVKPAGPWLLVDIELNDDSGEGYIEDGGGDWMDSLASLRAEVLAGDLRPLFIGWLAGVQMAGPASGDGGDDDFQDYDNDPVPPVPPGMRKLSPSQKSLAELLQVDAELLEVASADGEAMSARSDLTTAVAGIAVEQKNAWLVELLQGDGPLAGPRIKRQVLATVAAPAPSGTPSSRTTGDLRRAWADLDDKRRREAAAKAAAVKRKKDAEDAAAREEYLRRLSDRGDAVWREVDESVALRTKDGYTRSVTLMVDLKTIAERPSGSVPGFRRHLSQRLEEHATKRSFIALARGAGLV